MGGHRALAPLIVATTAGRVRGRREAGLTVWRGVPYAAAPAGALRFRAPQPPEPWPGVRDAGRDGPLPPQPRTSRLLGAGRGTPTDEDSLTMTIARRTEGSGRKPVMVFIYGGAYGIGGAVASAYRGETLAAAGDVVFVGFNYRLGALGWLDLSAYGTAAAPVETNTGLRDQIAALTWVRDNILAFGGDPGDVTLFGESAGATSVLTLMAVPEAAGLFQRAIAESPAIGAVHSAERSRAWAAELVDALPGGAAALRDPDTRALIEQTTRLDLAISDRSPGARLLGPVVDGTLLADYPVEVLARGDGLPVPLIIGTNADEGTLFQRMPGLRATPERVDRMFEQTVPAAKEGVLAAYPAKSGRLDRLVTDLIFWAPAGRVAAGHARVAPTWMYRFDFAPPVMRAVRLGAAHGAELDHVFVRRDSLTRRFATALGGGRAARALTGRVSTAWLTFTRTGAAPAWWPPFDPEARRTWVFDAEDRLETDPHAVERAAWSAWRQYG